MRKVLDKHSLRNPHHLRTRILRLVRGGEEEVSKVPHAVRLERCAQSVPQRVPQRVPLGSRMSGLLDQQNERGSKMWTHRMHDMSQVS